MNIKGLLFDLDGVIADTQKYHFISWQQVAGEYGITLDTEVEEQFKGISTMDCLEIMLERGNLTMNDDEKEKTCAKKTGIFLDHIERIDESWLFPGVRDFIEDAKIKGYFIALGSMNVRAWMMLERLGISDLYDAVVDGPMVEHAKPDPEVYEKAADALNLPYSECLVFEDAVSGINAAHNAGMIAIGVGDPSALSVADLVIPGFSDITISDIVNSLPTCDPNPDFECRPE